MSSGVSTAGKRELKKDEVRKSVFRVAMDLFRAKGFDETGIEEIATATGISPRTLFRHFPTKADIAFVPAWDSYGLLRQRVRSRPPSQSLFQAAETVALEHADSLEGQRERFLDVARLRAKSSALKQRRAYLLQVEFPEGVALDFAARDGLTEPGPLHVVAARWLLCVLSICLDAWIVDSGRTLHEHTSELIDLIKQGFAAV